MTADLGFQLVDAKTVASAMGLPVPRVWALVRAGKIPAVRVGHRTMKFDVTAVKAAVEAMTVGGPRC
jgi:excisionase family DNA binding protein